MRYPFLTKEWHDASNNLVILAAPDEDSLAYLGEIAALKHGIRCVPFYEPDQNDELTAVAFECGEKTSRFLSSLPLALKEASLV